MASPVTATAWSAWLTDERDAALEVEAQARRLRRDTATDASSSAATRSRTNRLRRRSVIAAATGSYLAE
jgi:hypothetical protein